MKNAVIGNNKQKANLIVLGAVPRYPTDILLIIYSYYCIFLFVLHGPFFHFPGSFLLLTRIILLSTLLWANNWLICIDIQINTLLCIFFWGPGYSTCSNRALQVQNCRQSVPWFLAAWPWARKTTSSPWWTVISSQPCSKVTLALSLFISPSFHSPLAPYIVLSLTDQHTYT